MKYAKQKREYGKMLFDMRTKAGANQAKVAKLAKVSQSHIAKLEAGKGEFCIFTLNKITAALLKLQMAKRKADNTRVSRST